MIPADVRKVLSTKIPYALLPAAVQNAIDELDREMHSKDESYNIVEALSEYLGWEGIIGYNQDIIELFKAALNVAQLEREQNERSRPEVEHHSLERTVLCPPDPAVVAYALAGRSAPDDPGACIYCHRSPGAQCWDEPNCSSGNRAGRRCLNTVSCEHPECDCYARND